MKKWIVAGFALLCLACSGLTETAMEMSGTSMEIGEDGSVTMTLPDGKEIRTVPKGDIPEDFPLPEPWEGAAPESVVYMGTEGVVRMTTVSYDSLKRPKEEVIAHYQVWFDAHTEQSKSEDLSVPGMATDSMVGTLADGRVAIVSITTGPGINTVSLVVQDSENPFGESGKADEAAE